MIFVSLQRQWCRFIIPRQSIRFLCCRLWIIENDWTLLFLWRNACSAKRAIVTSM